MRIVLWQSQADQSILVREVTAMRDDTMAQFEAFVKEQECKTGVRTDGMTFVNDRDPLDEVAV